MRERVRGAGRAWLNRNSNGLVPFPKALKRRQGRWIVIWGPPGRFLEVLETMNVSKIVPSGTLWTSKDSPNTSKEPRRSVPKPPREPLGALLIAFCCPGASRTPKSKVENRFYANMKSQLAFRTSRSPSPHSPSPSESTSSSPSPSPSASPSSPASPSPSSSSYMRSPPTSDD